MRIVDMKNEEGTFKIISDNKIIDINLNKIHPEIILEDNSMIVFNCVKAYYSFISDPYLFSAQDDNINLESLISEEFLVNMDTVSGVSYKGNDIVAIYELKYHEYPIYYIQRMGINQLAN